MSKDVFVRRCYTESRILSRFPFSLDDETKKKFWSERVADAALKLSCNITDDKFAWAERFLFFSATCRMDQVLVANDDFRFAVRLRVEDGFSAATKLSPSTFSEGCPWAQFNECLDQSDDHYVIGHWPRLTLVDVPMFHSLRRIKKPPLTGPGSVFDIESSINNPTAFMAREEEVSIFTSPAILDVSTVNERLKLPLSPTDKEAYAKSVVETRIRHFFAKIFEYLIAAELVHFPIFSPTPHLPSAVEPPCTVCGVYLTSRSVPINRGSLVDGSTVPVLANIILASFVTQMTLPFSSSIGLQPRRSNVVRHVVPLGVKDEASRLGRVICNSRLDELRGAPIWHWDFQKQWNPLQKWTLAAPPKVKTVKELLDNWDNDPI